MLLLLGLVRWLMSSDDDELADGFRDGSGFWSSWVVIGAMAGELAGDGTTDGGGDDVNWNKLTAAVDGWLLLLLLLLWVDSDDNKHDDDADDGSDADDDDCCCCCCSCC